MLSGLAAGLAAVIYVAHLGQAKADAGTGYELMAITAVVLGGASIFGGRGTVLGTVLGLFGHRDPAERPATQRAARGAGGHSHGRAAGGDDHADRLFRAGGGRPTLDNGIADGEDEVRNSQVGILSAVILAGA